MTKWQDLGVKSSQDSGVSELSDLPKMHQTFSGAHHSFVSTDHPPIFLIPASLSWRIRAYPAQTHPFHWMIAHFSGKQKENLPELFLFMRNRTKTLNNTKMMMR
jgi:hypothetical protein